MRNERLSRRRRRSHDPVMARMPVVFAPHGGGPWPFADLGLDRHSVESLSGYLRSLRALPKPRALLVVSAHWEAPVPTVMTSDAPPMLYDYFGFPPESYTITWPAPGAPALAARVRELVAAGGFASAEDPERGFDHGTFVPLKVAFPDAEIPTTQLSLLEGLDPEAHLRLGRALAPLRDEGVLIVGSGLSFHNLRVFFDPRAASVAAPFDAWLRDVVVREPAARDRALASWLDAPGARACHPREEHLLPLMVAAGAAGADRGTVAWNDRYLNVPLTAVHFS